MIGPVNNVVTVPTATPGGPTTLQLRGWLASYGLSYADSWAGNHNLPGAGGSSLLNLGNTGGAGSPPGLPVALTGLQGFRITMPEPPVRNEGTVTFVTRTLGPSAQILDWNGNPVGSPSADPVVQNGQNVLAQLYAAPGTGAAEASLLAVGSPVNVRN
ncbi:MAG: hypothetical protein HZB17_03950, partial [Chloroflexi bacterium]|nr:hypothetical protein [Chloroflexota bacterium]